MKPRTRWQGWTLVDKNGSLILSGYYDPEPFTWAHKKDAEETKEEGQRVVRCELRVIKVAAKRKLESRSNEH